MYGIPHGWGANLLMYNTDVVKPGADQLGRGVRRRARRTAGKVTAYDSPIYIADAALYLMKTQPDLGIKNPYALDEDQLAAAVDLLKAQREHVGEYWSDYLKEIQAFKTGDTVDRHHLAGHRQPRRGREGAGRGDPARGGLDRLVGHLDDQRRRPKHPNCAYAWLDYITSPEAQRRRWPSGSARRRPTPRPAT